MSRGNLSIDVPKPMQISDGKLTEISAELESWESSTSDTLTGPVGDICAEPTYDIKVKGGKLDSERIVK